MIIHHLGSREARELDLELDWKPAGRRVEVDVLFSAARVLELFLWFLCTMVTFPAMVSDALTDARASRLRASQVQSPV